MMCPMVLDLPNSYIRHRTILPRELEHISRVCRHPHYWVYTNPGKNCILYCFAPSLLSGLWFRG